MNYERTHRLKTDEKQRSCGCVGHKEGAGKPGAPAKQLSKRRTSLIACDSQASDILNSNYSKTAKNRAMDEHEALLPKNKTRVVERGALKTILIAFCGAAVLAGVAVPRSGHGGGLRGAWHVGEPCA